MHILLIDYLIEIIWMQIFKSGHEKFVKSWNHRISQFRRDLERSPSPAFHRKGIPYLTIKHPV